MGEKGKKKKGGEEGKKYDLPAGGNRAKKEESIRSGRGGSRTKKGVVSRSRAMAEARRTWHSFQNGQCIFECQWCFEVFGRSNSFLKHLEDAHFHIRRENEKIYTIYHARFGNIWKPPTLTYGVYFTCSLCDVRLLHDETYLTGHFARRHSPITVKEYFIRHVLPLWEENSSL